MKKILSVIIAVSCMAVLFVGCSAENGKIGNGVNGTVTDNQSNVSSNHNNASAGMNSGMDDASNSLGSAIEGGVSAAGSAIEGGVSAAGSAIQSGVDNMTGNNGGNGNTANGASENVSNAGV